MKKFLAIATAAIAVLATAVFFSCEKDNGALPEDGGIYSGLFTTDHANGTNEERSVGLVLGTDGAFTITSHNDGLPTANGHGEFSIKGNRIIFRDMTARNAFYTWDWILDGEYDYTFDGNRLKLSKEKDELGMSYKYDLRKVNGWLN